MAITQISKITHRKGLKENLPQLAGAELGWSLDSRQLFIGNGKITDGAPVIGNTEVLTQHSDILSIASTYTYKGTASGYEVSTGASISAPTTRTLQQKFDDFVSVRDFGAKGDGVTDDTSAINRALSELFTREVNTEVRRSLFFPAGTYKVTNTVIIPPFAKLYGEGANSSTIKYYSTGTVATAMVRVADNKNQTGENIGTLGALSPTNIEVNSMTFESTSNHDILLLEGVTNSSFEMVHLKGPRTTSVIESDIAGNIHSCIQIDSVASITPKNITFDKCATSGTGYAMHVNDKCNGITLSNSNISEHYKGVLLGDVPVSGGPTGVRVVQNIFNDIYGEGIEIGAISMNISAFNMFYDVGTHYGGIGAAVDHVIDIGNENNISIGDMFERNDADDVTSSRVFLNEKAAFSFDLSKKIELGTYVREVGKIVTLLDNTALSVVFQVNLTASNTSNNIGGFDIDYSIKRNNTLRNGTLNVSVDGGGSLTYNDSYVENASTGIVLSVTQSGTNVSVKYVSTNNGHNATFSYSIARLY